MIHVLIEKKSCYYLIPHTLNIYLQINGLKIYILESECAYSFLHLVRDRCKNIPAS